MTLLDVQDLTVTLKSSRTVLEVVQGVSFRVERGETLAIVGESGSGKSMTVHAVLRLLPEAVSIRSGSVLFEGTDLGSLDARGLARLRGARIGLVSQEPMTALNPVFTVGAQIVEALRLHRELSRAEAWQRAIELLGLVRIRAAAERAHQYPHELSGGMRQRVAIAMALACEPALLIADEPTTALDASTQASVLALIGELKERFRMGVLLVSHDLNVVAEVADRVAVMYAGRLVEHGPTEQVLARPAHPYTKGLVDVSRLGDYTPGSRLPEIPGSAPPLAERPIGCPFAPRCAFAAETCRTERPTLVALDGAREVACFRPLRVEPSNERREAYA